MTQEMPDFNSIKQGDSGSDSGSDEVVGIPVIPELIIKGNPIRNNISGIELIQPINDHHELKLSVHGRGELATGQDLSEDISEFTDYLGESLSLTIKPYDEGASGEGEMQFVGIVTNIEVSNSVDGLDVVTVYAKSPTIIMDASKKNAFFYDQMPTDITGSIVRSYSITPGDSESAGSTMKYCVQYRETDYDFICRLASNAGLFAFYDGNKFYMTKKGVANSVDLTWRQSLGKLTFKWGTAPAAFTSDLYQYEDKSSLTHDSSSSSSKAALSNISKISADASKKIYDKSGYFEVEQKTADAKALETAISAAQGAAMGRMIHCTGVSGAPNVSVGHRIKVSGMGNFNGEYLVLSVTHKVTEKGHYHNTFKCCPLDLAHTQLKSSRKSTAYLQSAEVVDVADPEQLGRIKVKFSWNDKEETVWIRVATPHAGGERGWYSIPEIGDEVLVGYQQGSPDRPIVLGALYNGTNKPAGEVVGDENNVKGFITRSGNKIVVDDTDGSEKISIVAKDGTQILLNSADPSVTVETSGDITLKGNNITLKADSKIALEGGQMELKSSGDLKAEASMNMNLKGGIEQKVEGTMVTIKGTPIQLN